MKRSNCYIGQNRRYNISANCCLFKWFLRVKSSVGFGAIHFVILFWYSIVLKGGCWLLESTYLYSWSRIWNIETRRHWKLKIEIHCLFKSIVPIKWWYHVSSGLEHLLIWLSESIFLLLNIFWTIFNLMYRVLNFFVDMMMSQWNPSLK